MQFRDRTDAGRQLVDRLRGLDLSDPVVLALPRGGVPVGFEVAATLNAALEVFVARKVGAPGRPEQGIGAIAEDGGRVVDEVALRMLDLSPAQFEAMVEVERGELERRVRRYRGERPLPELGGRDVILVDDGLATGVTAQAALHGLGAHRPRRRILTVPVCAPQSAASLREVSDEVICVIEPARFFAVGMWYDRFEQTTDAEVLDLLERASGRMGRAR